MKKKLALALVLAMGLAMTGCGDSETSGDAKSMVYAVLVLLHFHQLRVLNIHSWARGRLQMSL